MSKPQLTVGSTDYIHTMSLLSGAVRGDKIDIKVEKVKNIDECTKKMMTGDFDAGEMSFATFLKAKENGAALKAIPVFSRKWMPLYAYCAQDAPYTKPTDLIGKKIAVFQNWVTASIWHRWTFKHVYHADPKEMIWCPLREDRMDNMPYPEDHTFNWDYLGSSPSEALRSGQVDCFIYARRPADFTGLRLLFPDIEGELKKYLSEVGFLPITHVLAVKESVLEQIPGAAEELLRVFNESQEHGLNEVAHYTSLYLPMGDHYLDETSKLLGKDWNKNGWADNRPILQKFIEACHEQGFIASKDNWESWFVKVDL
jgi:4,5-dihydroxyphthalate decarboxylase